jgi:hypothetical protein
MGQVQEQELTEVISVPVRVHVLRSDSVEALNCTYSEADVRELFEGVNEIWKQAGIVWTLESVLFESAQNAQQYLEVAALLEQSGRTPETRRLGLEIVRGICPSESLLREGWNIVFINTFWGNVASYTLLSRGMAVTQQLDDRRLAPVRLARQLGRLLRIPNARQAEGNLTSNRPGATGLTAAQIEAVRKQAVSPSRPIVRVGQLADPDFDASVSNPTYLQEHPKVLIDEAHFNFHTAEGRYKPFADLISNDGYEVISNKKTFEEDVLAGGSILVIANARGALRGVEVSRAAFTQEECVAVRTWVQQGGGLLLIADHPPYGSAAAALASQFDVHMSQGTTLDRALGNRQGMTNQLVFTREDGALGDHPITLGRDAAERIDRVQTFTGQSLRGPKGAFSFLRLSDQASDRLQGKETVSAKGRSQGVALEFGQGRVVVLGEAGMLSAQRVGGGRLFGMNTPGIDNRQLALNIMHWLSGLPGLRSSASP